MFNEVVTWNPLDNTAILSNENLTSSMTGATASRATSGRASGKWYWEVRFDSGSELRVGVGNKNAGLGGGGSTDINYLDYISSGVKSGSGTGSSGNINYAQSFQAGDTISVLLDMDNYTLEFWKNGISQGIAWTGFTSLGEMYAMVRSGSSSGSRVATANFGASPFKYSIPKGYKDYNNTTQNKSFILSSDGYKKYDDLFEHSTEDVFLNPNDKQSGVTLSNNNMTASMSGTVNTNTVKANKGVESGKWYWETQINNRGTSANYPASLLLAGTYDGAYNSGFGYYTDANNVGWVYSKGTQVLGGLPPVLTNGVVGIAIDMDSPKKMATFFINGVLVASSEITLSGKVFPVLSSGTNGTGTSTVNFGATPFKHSIPDGYLPYFYKKVFVGSDWKTVSSTLPTVSQFQSEGMDDLSIFDRKVQTVQDSPQEMTNEVLGEGKLFKSTVDLKRYFDLRKLEVK